jgi:hypothetical protein
MNLLNKILKCRAPFPQQYSFTCWLTHMLDFLKFFFFLSLSLTLSHTHTHIFNITFMFWQSNMNYTWFPLFQSVIDHTSNLANMVDNNSCIAVSPLWSKVIHTSFSHCYGKSNLIIYCKLLPIRFNYKSHINFYLKDICLPLTIIHYTI